MLAVPIGELVLATLEVEGPDEACYRDIGATNDGVGHRVALIAVMTHVIAVVHVKFQSRELALCSGEIGGDTLVVDLRLSSLNLRGISDVEVIGDAAILLAQVVVAVEERLHLIAVANVAAKEAPAEVLVGLIVIRAF